MDKLFTVEQRSSERIAVKWRAKLLLPNGHVIDTRTFDISATGIGVLSEQPQTLKAVLQVALQVPAPGDLSNLQVVTGQAMVIFQVLRVNEYRVGMQWVTLPPETQKVLSAWTGARQSTPFQPMPGVVDL